MSDRIADIWGTRTPHPAGSDWPVGMDIAVHDGRIVGVRGHPSDRVNQGRLGPKRLYGRQAVPETHGADDVREIVGQQS
jgi:hypothetical protein